MRNEISKRPVDASINRISQHLFGCFVFAYEILLFKLRAFHLQKEFLRIYNPTKPTSL